MKKGTAREHIFKIDDESHPETPQWHDDVGPDVVDTQEWGWRCDIRSDVYLQDEQDGANIMRTSDGFYIATIASL
jgi:hypothetical protein